MKIAAVFGLLILVGCMRDETSYMKEMAKKPLRTPYQAFPSYPVSILDAPRAPKITPAQRRWIEKVRHSKNYRNEKLRFAVLPGWTTPIVVYVDHSDMNMGLDPGGHVIGEYCNAAFDPKERGKFPASEASCEGATPKPVI